jgi:hypothetical protein
MSRQSKHYGLGDDECVLEGHAASMAVHQGIDFNKAKEVLVEEYKKNVNRATSGGRVDYDKFHEKMDDFIQKNAIPK